MVNPDSFYLGGLSGADEELYDREDGCNEAAQDGDHEHTGHALQLQSLHPATSTLK